MTQAGLLCILIVCAFIARGGTQPYDDNWFAHHGLSDEEYEDTMECLTELQNQTSNLFGIPYANVTTDMINGCMLISLADCQEMLKEGSRKKRHIIDLAKYLGNRWTPPVLYEWHSAVDNEGRLMINASMQHWQDETCITFEEYNSNVHSTSTNRLIYTAENTGCYSYLGKQNNRIPQQVNVQNGGCTGWIGIVVHEIGHALGMIHEQSRDDRDEWVNLYTDNIKPSAINNFRLVTYGATHGCPYDYGSVMHYGRKDFSENCEDVLEATQPYSEYTMGQRGHLSYIDAKLANAEYCADVCDGSTTLACENGGYMDPKDCSKCRCPEGLGGTLCDTAGVREAVGAAGCTPDTPILQATETEQCLTSPGYASGTPYSNGDECNWIIQAREGCHVEARFVDDFGVYCLGTSCRGPSCYHWVELKYKVDKRERGGRFCCGENSGFSLNDPNTIVSEDDELVVHFDATWPQTSNAYTQAPTAGLRRGFKLCYKLNEACITTLLPTTVMPTTIMPTTMLPTTLLPTTVMPTTMMPTTMLPTTLLPTTVMPTTMMPTTMLQTTEEPYPYCEDSVVLTGCSHPCGGCGCWITRKTCFVLFFGFIWRVTIYRAEPCNHRPCDLSNPAEATRTQYYFFRFGSIFFIFSRTVPMVCCSDFCTNPPTALSSAMICDNASPRINPPC